MEYLSHTAFQGNEKVYLIANRSQMSENVFDSDIKYDEDVSKQYMSKLEVNWWENFKLNVG